MDREDLKREIKEWAQSIAIALLLTLVIRTYVVQAFKAGKGQSLKAQQAISCKSAEGARRTAERLAPNSAGVVAFSSTGDAEAGDYDDASGGSARARRRGRSRRWWPAQCRVRQR